MFKEKSRQDEKKRRCRTIVGVTLKLQFTITSRMRGHRCATNSLKKLELHKEGSIKENIEITFKACFGLLKGFCHKGKWIKIWA